MLLNEDVTFEHVRFVSYDAKLCFVGTPRRTLLSKGDHLYRLDYLPTNQWDTQIWWMQENTFHSLLDQAENDSEEFRSLAESGLALPAVQSRPLQGQADAGETYKRLTVTEIQLKQPVYGWVGIASAYKDQKGGLEQVMLPNLYIRGDQYHSNHAALRRTYLIPVK